MNNNNKNLKLKIAILSCCFITASINAITGNIPEMAKTFHTTPLHIVELITTIPALFSMFAILISTYLVKKTGYKMMATIGIVLCGVTGIIPVFIQNIYVILFARGLFGFGTGLISTSLIALIVYFFDGETRSTMIGLQGSIGGLGSLSSTFIAGQLLVHGWNMSFSTYIIAFIVLFIFYANVPDVKKEMSHQTTTTQTQQNKMSKNNVLKVVAFVILLFLSVAFANLYIVKSATLITEVGYGRAQDGSTVIMLISIGSLCSGALYGKIVTKIKKLTLPIFYLAIGLSFILASVTTSFLLMLISAYIFGFGFMIFVPYFQDMFNKEFAEQRETITRVALITQSLSGFVAPFIGNIITTMTPTTQGQYVVGGVVFFVLTLVTFVVDRNKKVA